MIRTGQEWYGNFLILLNFLKLAHKILTLYNLTHLCTNFVLVIEILEEYSCRYMKSWSFKISNGIQYFEGESRNFCLHHSDHYYSVILKGKCIYMAWIICRPFFFSCKCLEIEGMVFGPTTPRNTKKIFLKLVSHFSMNGTRPGKRNLHETQNKCLKFITEKHPFQIQQNDPSTLQVFLISLKSIIKT